MKKGKIEKLEKMKKGLRPPEGAEWFVICSEESTLFEVVLFRCVFVVLPTGHFCRTISYKKETVASELYLQASAKN